MRRGCVGPVISEIHADPGVMQEMSEAGDQNGLPTPASGELLRHEQAERLATSPSLPFSFRKVPAVAPVAFSACWMRDA
jgi:hypothetical protein